MIHQAYEYGDYVFTPCQNSINNKVSYWISKKYHTLALYCFTPMDSADLRLHKKEEAMKGYASYYEDVLARAFPKKTVRKYAIENWKQYNLGLNGKDEMLSLVNILEAYGETLDSLHAYDPQGGRNAFCNIYMSRVKTDAEIARVLLDEHIFYPNGIDNLDFQSAWKDRLNEGYEEDFFAFSKKEFIHITEDGIVWSLAC